MTRPAAESSRAPRRRRRWLLRVVATFTAIAVTTVVLVQVFLWTDYPRQIAEHQIQRSLHVRASVGSVRIGWLGRTHIENLKLTFPMESEPFLVIDSIDARHTSLPLIAFSQEVRSAKIVGARVSARMDNRGDWNLQQLVPSRSPNSTTNAAPTDLGSVLSQIPDIQLRAASLSLTKMDGKSLLLDPIEIDFTHDSPLTAKVTADAGPFVNASGRIGLTHALPHVLSLSIASVPEGLEAFLGRTLPETVQVKLDWSGQRSGDGFLGTLVIRDAQSDAIHVSGAVKLAAGTTFEAQPINLRIVVEGSEPMRLDIVHGRISYDQRLTLDALRGTLNGGTFALNGWIDPLSFTSDLYAEWANVQRRDLAVSGTGSLKTTRDFAGLVSAIVAVNGNATLPGTRLNGAIDLTGSGASARDFASDFTIHALTVDREGEERTFAVPDIKGSLQALADRAELRDVRFVDAGSGLLQLFGAVAYEDFQWWTTIDAHGLDFESLRQRGAKHPIELSVSANGTPASVEIQKLYLKSGPGAIWADGTYDSVLPRPLSLSTYLWYDKPVTEDDEARLNTLEAKGTVEGTLMPRDLSFDAEIHGSQLVFRERELGDVDVQVLATVDERAARLTAREMEVLGGQWKLDAGWSFAENTPPQIVATFRDLPISRVGEAAGRSGLQGTVERGTLTMVAPSTRLRALTATAHVTGSQLSFETARAESFELDASLTNGVFEVKPILREGAGTLRLTLNGDMDLAKPVSYVAAVESWPVPGTTDLAWDSPWIGAIARGNAKGEFTLGERGIVGDADVAANVTQDGEDILTIDVQTNIDGHDVHIAQALVKTLNGDLQASGTIDLENPNRSIVDASFERLDLSALGMLNPNFRDVEGQFGGSLSIHPSTGSRPLGALQILFTLDPKEARYRSIDIGPAQISAFATYDSRGDFRIVSDQAELHLADGVLKPFVRYSHAANGTHGQLITVDFEHLNLDQLQRAVDDDGKPITGRLGGNIQLYGYATSIDAISGAATLRVTESDLANVGPISALYNVLSVGTAGNKPSGEGSALLRLDAGVLQIDAASYFNRGVYARAYGPVRGLGDFKTAAIDDVIVIGSLQPLRAIKLPFFGDLNDILSALQSSVTALRVSGPIKEPKVAQVSLSEVGGTLRKILFGSASESNSGE